MADLAPTVATRALLSGYGDSYVKPGDEVYVIADDVFYTYRNPGTNPPSDGFDVIAAINLQGYWERGTGGGSGATLNFNTIAVGASGSGRLIDVAVVGLTDGTSLAWVKSVKDYFRWNATSTLTADNITIVNPTLNGVAAGRFIRELIPAPEWMVAYSTVGNGTVGCVIDGSNTSGTASDENDGLSGATALLTDDERYRRMGPGANWTQLEYHIRYVSDIDHVLLVGTLEDSFVFLHGSLTDGQGQTTLYTGTIDALTAQAPATNVAYQVTSNAIPVSWTASALIATGLANVRVRLTSNTVGATCYAVFDQGAKQARFSDAMTASTYTRAGWGLGFTNAVLVNGSTFVVEALTQIKYFHNELRASRGFDTVASGGTVIAESLFIGARSGTFGTAEFNCPVVGIFDACRLINVTASRQLSAANMSWRSCWISGTSVGGAYNMPRFANFNGISGGCDVRLNWQGVTSFTGFGAAQIRNNFFFQNGQLTVLNSAQVGILAMAVFDPPAAVQEAVFVTVGSLALFAANAALWGGGTVNNNLFVWFVQNRGVVMYSNLTNIALRGSTQDIRFSTGTSVPAFDTVASAYTAPRATTFALLATTVAGGGFGNFINDPVGGAQVTTN